MQHDEPRVVMLHFDDFGAPKAVEERHPNDHGIARQSPRSNGRFVDDSWQRLDLSRVQPTRGRASLFLERIADIDVACFAGRLASSSLLFEEARPLHPALGVGQVLILGLCRASGWRGVNHVSRRPCRRNARAPDDRDDQQAPRARVSAP
jgi:hypothetical protein